MLTTKASRNRVGGKRTGRRWLGWKLLGLAGLAGMAATGVVVARSERKRRAYTSEDVRSRLRTRAAELENSDPGDTASNATESDRRSGMIPSG